MSSPSNGILKTSGSNTTMTSTGLPDGGHSMGTANNGYDNTANKRSLIGSPSVQFSDNVKHDNPASGGPSNRDHQGGRCSRIIRAILDKTSDPFNRCRVLSLKVLHSRLMLIIICALVVIECACVMSELMVDLHGIKLRFDNEAEEINKFVTHFRKKHPDAFKSIELRRMKDFMHLLHTSTTPAAMDDALCQVCNPSNHEGRLNSEGSNARLFTTKYTTSIYETTTEQILLTKSASIPPYSNNDNLVDTGPSQSRDLDSKDEKLSPFKIKKQKGANKIPPNINSFVPNRIASNTTSTLAAIPTTLVESRVPRVNVISANDANVTGNLRIVTKQSPSNIDKGSPPQNMTTTKNNHIIDLHNTTTVLESGAATSSSEFQNTESAQNISLPFSNTSDVIPTINNNSSNSLTGVMSAQQSHRNNNNRIINENQNYIYDFQRNDTGTGIQSTENLFILAINNVKENFYLVAEMLPNHAKKNGSLHSRYMNEYSNVYKTSKALHYTSLTILGIMVIETAVKLFCTGCAFFKRKLEVFDAVIVVLSFCLDVTFLDSRWYETGKDATALLVLLLPWRVVRIVNSFVMTIKHKHHIQMVNLKRGKKKAELKTAKVQSLLKEIRKDVQLLVNLCKSAKIDENSINACLYGKGRSDGVTQSLMEACASLVLISTLGKAPSQEDDIYGNLIQEALDTEGPSRKSPEKQQEEEAAIDAAIALDDKIEAKRKSSRRKPSLSIRLQKALLQRSHTMPSRRCASMEIPDAEKALDMQMKAAENNVFYVHEDEGDIVPEGEYVIIDGDGRYYIRDIILSQEEDANNLEEIRSTDRNNTLSEL